MSSPSATANVAVEGRSASQVLAWSRTLFASALRDAVGSLPDSMGQIAGYHLGWLDARGNPAESDGGKAIRPALALLSAEAVGGAPEDAVPAAVAVELVHNFSLLHDDVIDGDETRRHRPTAWRVFGLANAILAGDALLTLAFEVLADSTPSVAGDPTRTLCATVQALIDGQHADLAFETRTDVHLGECERMAANKTGALLRCACTLGAMAGSGTAEQVDLLGQFGAALGLAFQLVDDVQGIWGDPAKTGKPARSDLGNRKKTLPVVAALESGTAAADDLAAWYRRDSAPTAADLVRAAELVNDAGGRQWCQAQLEGLHGEALAHLRSAGPPTRASAELAALAELVVTSARRS